jgi:hypothetical protein
MILIYPADVTAAGLFHTPHARLRAASLTFEVPLKIVPGIEAREQIRRWPAHAAALPPLPHIGKSSLLSSCQGKPTAAAVQVSFGAAHEESVRLIGEPELLEACRFLNVPRA